MCVIESRYVDKPSHPRLVRGIRIAIYNENHTKLGDVVLSGLEDL